MKMKYAIIWILILSTAIISGCTESNDLDRQQVNNVSEQLAWIDTFDLDECDFSPTGENEHFILRPGYQLTLEGFDEDNDPVELIITILNYTRTIDGVETRVLEERESVNGELEEISWNFFAYCEQTEDIYYFGEEVDIYDGGEVVSHDGAWKAGLDGARAGLMMPGTIDVGHKYYQEVAPNIAMDRAEILSDNETLTTPAGIFTNILMIQETTPLEPDEVEYKYHASGIGLIKDEELLLTSYGFIDLDDFPAYVTQQYAEEIATGLAGGIVKEVVTGEQAQRKIYIVELVDNDMATEVTIDALTGEVISKETSEYTGESVEVAKITEEQAKKIALKEVPGTVTDIVQERKGGKLVYVVEINYNNVETDVLIDIVTGEIIRIET